MRSVGLAESLWSSSGYEAKDEYGCIRLWRAVIEQIVIDFKSTAQLKNKQRDKKFFYQKQEAESMLFGHNKSHFDILCALACIEPDYVRRKIKEEIYQK